MTDWLSRFFKRFLDIRISISKPIFILIALVLLIQPVRTGYATAYEYIPSVDDAWANTLLNIKNNSEPDAIINSWWDFGHWFKYWADRAVTFDGASQNDDLAHWIGKTLLTDDEDMAVSILRMVDCGSRNGPRIIERELGDTVQTLNIVDEVLTEDRETARSELLNYISEETADEALDLMYCEPPENFFITSGDMVGKSGVWAHFGIWNFERAKIVTYFNTMEYNGFISALKNEFGYTDQEAQQTYTELSSFVNERQINNWVAPWPSYGGVYGCSETGNTTAQCVVNQQGNQIPVTIDLEEMQATIDTPDRTFYLNALGYMEDGEFEVRQNDEDLIGFAGVYHNKRLIVMSPELVGSMFTRLFYLDGAGLDHFKKFDDKTSVGGNRVITWKIDWNP